MDERETKAYTSRIAAATRTELIVIMYEITKDYILSGINEYKGGNTEKFKYELKKARQFVNELNSALNTQYQISAQLSKLYMFINRTLLNAILRLDISELDRIIGILDKLREAFIIVASKNESGPVMQNVQPVYSGLTYGRDSRGNETTQETSTRGFRV